MYGGQPKDNTVCFHANRYRINFIRVIQQCTSKSNYRIYAFFFFNCRLENRYNLITKYFINILRPRAHEDESLNLVLLLKM